MKIFTVDSAPDWSGWAIGTDKDGAVPRWGSKQFSDYGDADELLMRDVRDWTLKMLDEHHPDRVAFEEVLIYGKHIASPKRHKQFSTVQGVDKQQLHKKFSVVNGIKIACVDRGIPCGEVLITVWRKRFLGRIQPPKWVPRDSRRDFLKEAAEAECLRRNWLVQTNHEAEALGMWHHEMFCHSYAYRQREKANDERRELAAQTEDKERA